MSCVLEDIKQITKRQFSPSTELIGDLKTLPNSALSSTGAAIKAVLRHGQPHRHHHLLHSSLGRIGRCHLQGRPLLRLEVHRQRHTRRLPPERRVHQCHPPSHPHRLPRRRHLDQ